MLLPQSPISEQFQGKYVWVRLDWNVPIVDGKITDATRITQTKQTLSYLKQAGAKVLILAHMGRPTRAKKSTEDDCYFQLEEVDSFKHYIEQIIAHLKIPLHYIENPLSQMGAAQLSRMDDGDIALCDNVRFFKGEETNSDVLSDALAALATYYVNDAFSCSHRAHVSTVGLAKRLPSYMGINLKQELDYLKLALNAPKRPLWAIVAGSKVSTKLDVLTHLSKKVDGLIIGGAMANTFLKAKAIPIGASLFENDYVETAAKILKNPTLEIMLPTDAIVAKSLSSCDVRTCIFEDIHVDECAFDIGPASIEHFKTKLQDARTIVWNGPVGVFENEQFSKGTMELAKFVSNLTAMNGTLSISGGGDTLAAIHQAGVAHKFTHLSTAGGAFLEWLEGRVLPGIEALG